jgi:hypothetical protein
MGEGVAVVAARAAACGSADMGEEKRRTDLPRQALQIAIRPCGQDITVAAGFGPVAIPGNAEAIAIRRRLGAGGAMRLLDQRMGGRGYQFLEIERISAIGCPATQGSFAPEPAAASAGMLKLSNDAANNSLTRGRFASQT